MNRIVSQARNVLNDYIPDVWIYTDLNKGSRQGESSGFAVSLCAETNKDCFITADDGYDEHASAEDNLPENVGERAALRLLDEILYVNILELPSKLIERSR